MSLFNSKFQHHQSHLLYGAWRAMRGPSATSSEKISNYQLHRRIAAVCLYSYNWLYVQRKYMWLRLLTGPLIASFLDLFIACSRVDVCTLPIWSLRTLPPLSHFHFWSQKHPSTLLHICYWIGSEKKSLIFFALKVWCRKEMPDLTSHPMLQIVAKFFISKVHTLHQYCPRKRSCSLPWKFDVDVENV